MRLLGEELLDVELLDEESVGVRLLDDGLCVCLMMDFVTA